ncbi:MAG: peptidoglycan DD-metalloendopeptidase family protein [Burkholderiales bacterium]|nr:peptidoglycan DD-metalloendopeptidase family protein [Burkholderiales bacterium]
MLHITHRHVLAGLAGIVALSGCATTSLNEAPIVDRSSRPAVSAPPGGGVVSQPPASRQAKDGMYTVQRGDTLYGIALAFGQDAREIARWNGIEDPSRLTVGQSLRVAPPTAAAVTAVPVAPVAAAQTQPLASGTAQLPGGGAALPPIAPAASSAPATAAGSGVPSAAAATPPVATASATAPALPSPGATTAPPVAAAAAPSAASTKPGEAALGGNWAWPIEGKVIETFNETRNKGIDIAGKEGDPVMAAADGQVVYIGSGLRGYGNLVIVKHDDDYVTAYAHNRQILVKQGQSVSRGQRIAELGKTDAELPKLHFEIRRQGKPIDPLTVLPKR